MSDLQSDFQKAATNVQKLGVRPDNDTLLTLYALYKQATEGDLRRTEPGFFDFIGTAKHEAWTQLQGLSHEASMKRYIALVEQLTH